MKPQENLEILLQELIEEVKQHSEQSKKRIALTKFLRAIYKHKHFLVISNYTTELPDYEEIHQQALQDTILTISQKIDSYESGRPILPWIRGILNYKFIDSLKRNRSNTVTILSLDNLNYDPPSESNDMAKNNLQNFIIQDPENILESTTLRGYSHVTFQRLLLFKLIEDKTWETIATELGVKVSTISNFYQRNIQKHKAYFEKYLM